MPGMSIKDALTQWEEARGVPAANATDIGLQFTFPPIEKMDATLGSLITCEKLSLSSNRIEKIAGIGALKNLKILSLARNNIKSLAGIEVLGDTLEQLWVSYNNIEKLKQLESMKALKIFYVTYNSVKDWSEFMKMGQPNIEEISFIGNPIAEAMDEAAYRSEAIRRLQNIKKLDGETVIRD